MNKLPKDFCDLISVSTSGCWVWGGATTQRGGYGLYGKTRAHRFSLTLYEGNSPEGKPYALHSCDNPPCVNPGHLRWGSAQDNTDDMFERGRSKNPRATKQKCARGHRWVESGFFMTSREQKICKRCRKESWSDWHTRRTSEGYTPPIKSSIEHGTINAYQWGCRCEPCVEVKRVDSKNRNTRMRGQFPNHGTSTSYTRGCRCPVCKSYKSESDKAAYKRRVERGK